MLPIHLIQETLHHSPCGPFVLSMAKIPNVSFIGDLLLPECIADIQRHILECPICREVRLDHLPRIWRGWIRTVYVPNVLTRWEQVR